MLKRIRNLIRGFASLFISGLERQNPEALLELEQENLRKQIASFNAGLTSHAGLVERLHDQVRRLLAEQAALPARVNAAMKAGNRDLAGQHALRLQTVDRELDEYSAQLQQAETTYRELTGARNVAVTTARSKIESLRSGLSDMRVKQAIAELMEMSSSTVSRLGSSGDSLNRLDTMISGGRQQAAGRLRVAVDSLDMSEFHLKENEQKALAEYALTQFEAKQNQVPPVARPQLIEAPRK